MSYTLIVTDITESPNVVVGSTSYSLSTQYNATVIDGVGIDTLTVNGSGNLIVTKTDATTVDAGHVVGADGANGTNGTNGVDGTDGISVISASTATGNLILTLSDSSTIDAGAIQASVDWSNVHITGGTIDNTIIGNVTPAAGTFTNLAATVIDSATLNGGYF